MNRKRAHRRARGLAALLALLLSVQAIAWVAHAVEHGGWLASASGEARQAAPDGSRDLVLSDDSDRVHLHGGPFSRCGACDALAQLQAVAPPARIWLAPVRAALPDLPDPGAVQAQRILPRATARGPPRG